MQTQNPTETNYEQIVRENFSQSTHVHLREAKITISIDPNLTLEIKNTGIYPTQSFIFFLSEKELDQLQNELTSYFQKKYDVDE